MSLELRPGDAECWYCLREACWPRYLSSYRGLCDHDVTERHGDQPCSDMIEVPEEGLGFEAWQDSSGRWHRV